MIKKPTKFRKPTGEIRNGDAGNFWFEFIMIIAGVACIAYFIADILK